MSTSTPVRPARRQHRGNPVTGRHSHQAPGQYAHTRAPSTVSPAQFVEPPHTRALPEQHHPIADHSDTAMRRLRTPFEPGPA